MHDPNDAEWQKTLFDFCQDAARWLLKGASFAELRARLMPGTKRILEEIGITQEMHAPGMVEAMATMLSMEIWNATPLPDNRFRPRKLTKPERNAPCPCGSGNKYKQCCAELPPFDIGISEPLMLATVLDLLPATALATVPLHELSSDSLATVAQRWLDEGRAKRAVGLLERYFTTLEKLDGRAEFAADTLLNAYLDTNSPRKKQKFVEALKGAPDKDLRSCGWQRQATMCSDTGDYTGAWTAFREAQRQTPNAPALSHLEVLLLLSEGRDNEAKARADFWIARLQRDSNFDYSDLITSLRNMVGDDNAKLRAMNFARGPLQIVADTVANWPVAACEYRLVNACELEAKAPLALLEDRWMAIREGDDLEALITFAVEHPLSGQSFMILRDMSEFAQALNGGIPGSNEALSRKILERGEALRQTVLTKLKASKKELPWGFLSNRPLLTLVDYYVDAFTEARHDECLDLMRWSVTVANPTDNIGMREGLIHNLVAAGQASEAIAIAARYPDDFASTEYGRVLAYFSANEPGNAQTALRQAIKKSPKVWKMLHAANPKKPRSKNPGYFTVGGDDEAWLYRDKHLALWRSTGALKWSMGVKPEAAHKAPPPDNTGKQSNLF